jgi:hypothetical protein
VNRFWLRGTAALALLGALTGCKPDEPTNPGAQPVVQRLSEQQYRQTIADIFGPDIKVTGRFEPIVRREGLQAVGAVAATVTSSGFEQFDVMARGVAAQVLDDKHRAQTVDCRPKAEDQPDSACAADVLARYGRLLFRRPLTDDELKDRVAVADAAARSAGNFYAGLQFALATELEMPEFLFRIDRSVPDPDHPGQRRLDAYSKASRLSFLLWNTSPDAKLLDAAEHGDLDTRRGLAREVDRLLASPRLEDGVRAFFSDMLVFESFDTLAKDALIYPKFSTAVAASAQEQTLRTIVDLLVHRNADYRDLFVSRHTFMNRPLGPVYYVPVASKDGWEPFDFPDGDPRGGLLSQVSFTALYAHPGQSSPTLRGKAIRELLLCQKVPAPPANVDFTVAQDTSNPLYRTARARLTAHRTAPTCAGCHKIMDPIGLGLENFDGAGVYRTKEGGEPIDASGELDGRHFSTPIELGQALHDDPAATACLVSTLYKYAAGRAQAPGETAWLKWLNDRFAADGYRVVDLLRTIATSDGFYAVRQQAPVPQTQADTQRPQGGEG